MAPVPKTGKDYKMIKETFMAKAAKVKEALVVEMNQFEEALMEAIPLRAARITKEGDLQIEIYLDDIKGDWDLMKKNEMLESVPWVTVVAKKGDHFRSIVFEVPEQKKVFDPNDRIGDGR